MHGYIKGPAVSLMYEVTEGLDKSYRRWFGAQLALNGSKKGIPTYALVSCARTYERKYNVNVKFKKA